MSPYDLAMIGVVIAGMIWGALRGITWQLASMASLVLGYAVSFPMSSQLAPHFPGEPIVARALAMLTLYVAVSGGIFLAAWSIRAILRKWQFEAYDRHLGMVLGGLEGAILGTVVTVFVISLAPKTREPILDSTAGKVVGGFLDAVGPVLPGEIRTSLAKHWDMKKADDSLASALADDIRSSLKQAGEPLTEPEPGGAVAAIEEDVQGLVREGAAALSNAANSEKSDPSLVKSVLKRENERSSRRAVANDPSGPSTVKGLLKQGGARIGAAISDTISDEIDKFGEGSNDRKIERR
jgi:membrane protein required for colicin V production